jgi:hypothetical protein
MAIQYLCISGSRSFIWNSRSPPLYLCAVLERRTDGKGLIMPFDPTNIEPASEAPGCWVTDRAATCHCPICRGYLPTFAPQEPARCGRCGWGVSLFAPPLMKSPFRENTA